MSIYNFTVHEWQPVFIWRSLCNSWYYPNRVCRSYLMMILNIHHDIQQCLQYLLMLFNRICLISCAKPSMYAQRQFSVFNPLLFTVVVTVSRVTTSHYSCCRDLLLPRNKFTDASMLVLAAAPFKQCQMKVYFSLHKTVLQFAFCTWLIHHWFEPFKGQSNQ